jgi:amino acid permease
MNQELLTREEVMAGLPARRARTLLFLIESRTAHLVAQSRQAMEFFPTEEAAEERELAFLEAFALGRDPPLLRPTIQDMECQAQQWAHLVPDNPRVQASVAHLLSRKYDFTYQDVPGIRAALDLDEEAVQRAYRHLYHEPLETIYVLQVKAVDRLRWVWAALGRGLEALPPFWTAFVFIVAISLPQTFLALPIAMAGVGPLAGVVLVAVLGVINILTVACIAEAITRNGNVRYGTAFIGRIVADYLGHAGSFVLTLAVAILFFLALLASYIGLAATLANFTGVPGEIWAALLFLLELYLLSRLSLGLTVSFILGVVNIGLILMISLLALPHLRAVNLLYVNVPLLGGRPFEPSVLQPVFGVALIAYFGHVLVSQCARIVLPRDPDGRSLIRGSMAGMVCLAVLLCIWVLAVNGAVAPDVLAGEGGTVVVPLAAEIGAGVQVLGPALVTLLLGLTSLRCSNVLFNLVRERLPARPRQVLILPRQQGRLLFSQQGKPDGSPVIGLTYLGLSDGRPQFRLDVQWDGNTHCVEMAIADRWEDTALLDQIPGLRKRGIRLALEVLDASQESVRLQVTSPMNLAYDGDWDVEALAGVSRPMSADVAARRARDIALSERGRFFLSVSPVAMVFLLTEWLLLSRTGSFAMLLSLAGVISVSLITGIFPALLLVSSRRKGEFVPGVVYRFLGHPLLTMTIYLLFLATIFLHGLIIWQNPAQRVSALVIGLVVLAATMVMVRRGAFAPRVVVEVREDQRDGGPTVFAVTAGGQPRTVDVRLTYPEDERYLQASSGEIPAFSSLRRVTFQLPATPAKELKVWAHMVVSDGSSKGLPSLLEVHCGGETKQFDLKLSGGQVLLPLTSDPCQLDITLPEPSPS